MTPHVYGRQFTLQNTQKDVYTDTFTQTLIKKGGTTSY